MKEILLSLFIVFCFTGQLLAQAPPPPGPSQVHAVGRDSICQGDTTLLVVMDTTLRGTIHISWSPSTGLSCDTCDTLRAYPTVTTHYTLIAHDSLKADTNTVVIAVNPSIPSVSFFYSNSGSGTDSFSGTSNPPLDSSNGISHFTARVLDGFLPPTFTWQVNGQDVGHFDTLSILLGLGDTVSCMEFSICSQFEPTYYYPPAVSSVGINKISIDNHVKLSPNPGNGIFSLSMTQPAKQITIELWNVQGQLLYTEQNKQWASGFNKPYNFSELAKGLYLLKVSTENGVAVKRVVIE